VVKAIRKGHSNATVKRELTSRRGVNRRRLLKSKRALVPGVENIRRSEHGDGKSRWVGEYSHKNRKPFSKTLVKEEREI